MSSSIPAVRTALARASVTPDSLTDAELAALLLAEGEELDALTGLADALRREAVGEAVRFVVNRNVSSDLFGASVPPTSGPHAGAPRVLDLAAIGDIADDAWQLGATELCVQGTVPAAGERTADAATADAHPFVYADIARAVKARQPGLHLHAFRPADLVDGARRSGLGMPEFLASLREAGVDSVPGTGVKLLDETQRRRLAPGDLPVDRWLEVVRAAHGLGFRSTSIMFYGRGESPAARVAHLRTLARLQEETGGFTEFVPMPFPELEPLVTARSELDEHRAVTAVARLALLGRIDHLQVPWTKLGLAHSAVMLESGADDLGGTLYDGRVLPSAGVEYGRSLSIADIERTAAALGRPARQRTTVYGEPSAERLAAARTAGAAEAPSSHRAPAARP